MKRDGPTAQKNKRFPLFEDGGVVVFLLKKRGASIARTSFSHID
jgi:hypothetical protein